MHSIQQALEGATNLDMLDAEVLLAHILQKDRTFLHSHSESKITNGQAKKFEKLIRRRSRHEPVAYILGKKEFFGRDFLVNKNVLIPRPLTEHLVEAALEEKAEIYVDVGTGSGCIAITLALECGCQVVAIDTSRKALKVAKRNAQRHGVLKKIKFLRTSQLPEEKSMVVVANLPYISPPLYKGLSSDIKNYEPKGALIAPEEGLFYYRKLLEQIEKMGRKIVVIMEILPQQKQGLSALVKKNFPNPTLSFPHECIARLVV